MMPNGGTLLTLTYQGSNRVTPFYNVMGVAKAALESVGYQTRDLLDAMSADWQAEGVQPVLRVDGGMVASDWAMQFLADILGAPVDRPVVTETTALGAAYLAGLQSGICQQVVGLHIGGILIERLLGDEDRLQWV